MTPIHLIGNSYAVEMPSMAFGFDINNYGDESELMYMLSMEDIADESNSEETLIVKKLPPGNWQIICTMKEVTRSQAAELMQWFEIAGERGYRDYAFPDDLRYPFLDPISSWRSLLKAMGIDQNKNYVLIKKVA